MDAPNLLADYLYLWETTVVRQAIETARASASSGGHSSSYWCQQRQLAARSGAILSEGHGPEHAQRRRACRRGGNAEWSSAQDAGMENTCRGFGRAYEIGAHCCCDDRFASAFFLRRLLSGSDR